MMVNTTAARQIDLLFLIHGEIGVIFPGSILSLGVGEPVPHLMML